MDGDEVGREVMVINNTTVLKHLLPQGEHPMTFAWTVAKALNEARGL
jgi:hypothetical protein